MGIAVTLKKLLIGRAFETERGRIKLFGKMNWTLVPARALAKNFQSIAEKSGEEFLYYLGYEAGHDAAKEMIKFMGLVPKSGWTAQNAILALLEFIGFGRTRFITSKLEKDGQHHFVLHVYDNPVIEHANKLFGPKSKVCNWFMGVYAAHGEMEMGIKNSHVKENKCLCKGAPYCEWETKWWKDGK
jgi:predicted hydrocarbon binding protein